MCSYIFFFNLYVLSFHHHQDMLEPIFVSPEDYGDLYLDIFDAYMENSECRCLPSPLVSLVLGPPIFVALYYVGMVAM